MDAQNIPVLEQPEDLVGACLYVASDAAHMMTGQTLTVDGGTAFNCSRDLIMRGGKNAIP